MHETASNRSPAAVIEVLQALEELLRGHAVSGWADRLHTIRKEAGQDRQALKQRVLTIYRGTMGSFTDLIIARVNGHVVDDERAANATLERLRTELWERTTAL